MYPVCVYIYIAWCQHCRKLMPIYEQAAEIISKDPDRNFQFGKVEGDKNEEIIKNLNIKRYPTILIFGEGTEFRGIDFQGERTVESLISALLLYSNMSPVLLSAPSDLEVRMSLLRTSFALGLFKKGNKGGLEDIFMAEQSYNGRLFYSYEVDAFKEALGISWYIYIYIHIYIYL